MKRKCKNCDADISHRAKSAKWCKICGELAKHRKIQDSSRPTACTGCGKEIVNKRSNAKWCSRNCLQKFQDIKPERFLKRRIRVRPYIIYKKECCEFCGFKAVHPCQLDIDHKDGNHNNNTIDNLQTLCANCHRLKTQIQRDWEN